MSKFLSVESKLEAFRCIAKSGYEKGHCQKASFSSPRAAARKRIKDTNGVEASPHTVHSRPVAKCLTVGAPGRRLAFSNREQCRLYSTQ